MRGMIGIPYSYILVSVTGLEATVPRRKCILKSQAKTVQCTVFKESVDDTFNSPHTATNEVDTILPYTYHFLHQEFFDVHKLLVAYLIFLLFLPRFG